MKREKIIAILTILAMLISMAACFALPGFAEEAGEKQEIKTAEELIAIASGDLSGNYVQVADIDLTGKKFIPIGDAMNPFTGIYDGNGYEIKGLTIEGDGSFQGLFGVNCGEIRNLTMAEDCSVSGSSYVGAVAGFNQGKIENCISRATVSYTAAEEDANAPTYGIMSQNLCQWGDNDLTKHEDYQDSVSHSRRPAMIKRIENSNPDILLFQEVSFNNYKYNGKTITAWDTFLRNTLTDFTIVGTYRSNSDKEGVTIGFRKDKFDLLEEGMFWLSENPDAPRAQQGKAWDAACVRAAQFVVLQDKTTGQKIIACSTHTDHVGVIARDKGTKLVAERMKALQEKYPDALLAVGGDFNNTPGSQGYLNMEAGIHGLLDDSRYVAEERLNNIGTHGSITDLTYVGGELDTIDYIYINSATTEAATFYVMNDNYNDFRPSDHEGVFASVKERGNHFIGGICGANGGNLSNIVAEGEVDGGEVFGSGSLAGNALYRAEWGALYAKDTSTEKMAGTPISLKTVAPKLLPEIPSQMIVDLLNQSSGVFELRDEKYAILEGCGQYELAKVVFRGVPKYCFVGSTFTFEVEEGLEVYVNGELFEGRSIIVPSEGAVIRVLEPIQSVETAVSGGDFVIASDEDFLYLLEHIDYFRYRGVTIHQRYDIDLSKEIFASFSGFKNPAFSWEGYGHKIENWGSKEAPGGVGFYRISTGEGGANFVRNIKFSNIHVSGSSSAVVYATTHANAGLSGLPTHLELSGISMDGCSMKSTSQSSGLLLSRYGSTGADYTVDIFNIRITNCEIDANSWEHIGFIVGKIRTASGCEADFNISDCYLYNNTIKNAVPGVGFLGGSVEAQTYVTFRNIGVFKCSAEGSCISYLASDSHCAGLIDGKGMIFAENTAETDESYMVAGVDAEAVATINLSDYWCDGELTALIDGQSDEYAATTAAVMASGEAGWAVNALQEAPSFWWAQDGSIYKPCGKDERLCKVELQLQEKEIRYLSAGSKIELPDIGEGTFELLKGESVIEDGVLTIKSDTVLTAKIPTSFVEGAVVGGNYTINSLEDWMALYQNIEYFRNPNVTIHLQCDIDLSEEAAAEFTCFENPAFSFDGHGHTIKNWGSKEAPITSRALFYVTDGNYGMNFIENLKFSNCHMGNGGGNQAVLYTAAHGNGGYEGLPTALNLENIHFDGCSIKATGENAAFLLARYGVANAEFTVNIRNCSVKNSSLDAGGTAHKGLLVGKTRGTSYIGTFNIADCYLEGNTITNAVNGAGFIYGTAEGEVSKVIIQNVGVLNNSLTSSVSGAYAGYSDYTPSLPVELKGVLFAGNTMNAKASYLIGSTNQTAKMTYENVYGDMENLTGAAEGDTAVSFTPNAEQVASGEAGWLLNQKMKEPLYYWGMADGKYIQTDKDHRIAKVSFVFDEQVLVKEIYISCGSAIELSVEQDPDATFSLEGAPLTEGSYLLPLDREEITISVHSEDQELFMPRVSQVLAAVSEGNYVILNLEDWLYLFDHTDYFNHEDVVIHLKTDLDLSGEEAARFSGFSSAKFIFNGGGHTLSNWTSMAESQENYKALFMNYSGKSISNLQIDGFKIGGGYGRSILIGGYSALTSLEVSNVHIKNSTVDATVSGNQMGIFLARSLNNAESGAVISFRNCSAISSTMKNSSEARINNSGIMVGSAYRNYNYALSDILIQDCRVETNTGAGGIVVGAVESASQLSMERVGVFHNSIQPNETNDLPGIFVGEMSGTVGLTMRGCMAADNTADEREEMALICYSGKSVTFSASHCLVDPEPLAAKSTNNAEGSTESVAALGGADEISAAAFKSGEAAWKMNSKLDGSFWLVGEQDDYPTLFAGEGFAAPYKVTFGEAEAYTNALGQLSEEEAALMLVDEGHWLLAGSLVQRDTIYGQDTALTFEKHLFESAEAIPEGEEHHKLYCAAGCGAEKIEECVFDQGIAADELGRPIHYGTCICKNRAAVECELSVVALGGEQHQRICLDCGYEEEAESCRFTSFSHIEGTETHIGVCADCGAESAAHSCEKIFKQTQAPAIEKEGKGFWICSDGCGYYQEESMAALGDCDENGEITIADVVLVLRVISGDLNAAEINMVAANVYTDDGFTQDGGLNTADALALLKYLMEKE